MLQHVGLDGVVGLDGGAGAFDGGGGAQQLHIVQQNGEQITEEQLRAVLEQNGLTGLTDEHTVLLPSAPAPLLPPPPPIPIHLLPPTAAQLLPSAPTQLLPVSLLPSLSLADGGQQVALAGGVVQRGAGLVGAASDGGMAVQRAVPRRAMPGRPRKDQQLEKPVGKVSGPLVLAHEGRFYWPTRAARVRLVLCVRAVSVRQTCIFC